MIKYGYAYYTTNPEGVKEFDCIEEYFNSLKEVEDYFLNDTSLSPYYKVFKMDMTELEVIIKTSVKVREKK